MFLASSVEEGISQAALATQVTSQVAEQFRHLVAGKLRNCHPKTWPILYVVKKTIATTRSNRRRQKLNVAPPPARVSIGSPYGTICATLNVAQICATRVHLSQNVAHALDPIGRGGFRQG